MKSMSIITSLELGKRKFNTPIVIAGPCAVEGEEQMLRTAEVVCRAGGQLLRGGAFKPRTSPYSFQGIGKEGLKEMGRSRHPVILKRGMAATAEEWMCAAEYIRLEGNPCIILCERGIRTFAGHARNTLDLSVVPYIKMHSDLPVIVDPSHATGDRSLVIPMARAALGAGCDGLMLEVHPDPDRALCDGSQSLTLEQFEDFMAELGNSIRKDDGNVSTI